MKIILGALILLNGHVCGQNIVSMLLAPGFLTVPKATTTTQAPVKMGNSGNMLCQIMGWFSNCGETAFSRLTTKNNHDTSKPVMLEGVGKNRNELDEKFGTIDENAYKEIKNDCEDNSCKEQDPKDIVCRETLIRRTIEVETKFLRRDMAEEVHRRFEKVTEYKKMLAKKSGLDQILEPRDNGLVDHDVLLTEEQAMYLIDQLNGKQDTNDGSDARNKRNALYMEARSAEFAKKWNVDRNHPIPYMLAEDLEDEEIEWIEKGLKMITDAAPCITFKHDPEANLNGKHYIYYYRAENIKGICGLSPVGKIPDGVNGIQLNFGDFGCPDENMPGVAAHETMHSLGIEHTHLRDDREKYMEIKWEKIDPQKYQTFLPLDAKRFTTYGVPFDFESIMTYSSKLGSKSGRIDTMIPLRDTKKNSKTMGQRTHLSNADKEMLRKMYCYANNCHDNHVNCGYWATNGMCTNPPYRPYMKRNCRKSCGYCGGTQHF